MSVAHIHKAKAPTNSHWSHRDVFRLVHPVANTPAKEALYRWVVAGKDGLGPRVVTRVRADNARVGSIYGSVPDLPRIVQAFEEAKTADEKTVVKLIREDKLPRECIPTQHLNSVAVWEALLESSMPLTAMIRNLAKMTAVGLLKPLSGASKIVMDRLGDAEYIRKSRVHPIAILLALKTYAQGRGEKGSLTWSPVQNVVDALDAAFYTAFGNVIPANKRTLLAVDLSASMTWCKIAGTGLMPREAAAAIAMVTAKTEPQHAIVGFSSSLIPLEIGKFSRLDHVIDYIDNQNAGGTDCSLPIVHASRNNLEVDTFITLTDNETYAGGRHVFQCLEAYRKQSKIPARSIVAAFTATNFTIADPSDPLSLDIAGLDSATPALISDFSAGRF